MWGKTLYQATLDCADDQNSIQGGQELHEGCKRGQGPFWVDAKPPRDSRPQE